MASAIVTRIDDLKTSFERMSQRERVMVGGLVGAVALLIVLGVAYWIYSGLEDLEQHNLAARKALQDVDRLKGRFVAAQRRTTALNQAIPQTALELNTYVEQAASKVGVKIDESSERSPAAAGRYTQRSLEIKVRKIDIGKLGALLKRLEGSSSQLVQVTQLNVRTRWGHHESLDVELTVSTYEQRKAAAPAKRRRRGRSRSGSRG